MTDEVKLTDDISEAHALLALQSKLKKNPGIQAAARSHGIPIYVTKTSASPQLTKAIRALIADHAHGFKDFDFEDNMNSSQKIDALEEARVAIEQVVIPKGEPVELLPRPPNIISLQKDLVQKYKLQSKRIGTEPDERLRILPFQTAEDEDGDASDGDDGGREFDEFSSLNSDTNGSPYVVDRLPLLPE